MRSNSPGPFATAGILVAFLHAIGAYSVEVALAKPRAEKLPGFLTDRGAARQPDRVHRVVDGAISLSAAGSASEQSGEPRRLGSPQTLVVVSTGAGWPRVLVESLDVRLAVHVDPTSLATVVTRETLLTRTPEAARRVGPRTVGIRLRAGAIVQTAEDAPEGDSDTHAKVSYRTRGLEATGFVARERLGQVFRPVQRGDGAGAAVCLQGNATLLDAPEGDVVARLSICTDCGVSARRLSRGRDHVLVELYVAEARVIGWVASHEICAGRGATFGYGGGHGSGGSGTRVTLHAGAHLHDGPGGAVVGVVRRDATLSLLDRGDGWLEVRVVTRVAAVRVWVREAEVIAVLP